jgi:hypothetical protein
MLCWRCSMSSVTCFAISWRMRGEVPGCHDGSDTKSRFRLSCNTCRDGIEAA